MSKRNSFGAFPSVDDRVRDLVGDRLSGRASEAQVAELSELITSNSDVLDYYIAQSALVSQLTVIGEADSKITESRIPGTVAPNASTWRWPIGSILVAGSLCAMALVVLFVAPNIFHSGEPQLAGDRIGQMVPQSDEDTSLAVVAGETVSLEDGDYDITLDNGVQITVSAPATFAMESDMLCRLRKGKLIAIVPEQAIGFRVITNHADIVDQGTRFGVAVGRDHGTDVAVFEGQVDVASHNKSLVAGRAVSIGINGKLSRLQVVRPETFESDEPVESTIRSVRDNTRSLEELGFYRIVPGGFNEDQLAYVDREHEWNGVDSEGLPAELRGGDYVLPFNDDKLNDGFEITVSLTEKANIYVLFDDRNEAPAWLKENFVDTGKDVGQDEGHVHGDKPHRGGISKGSGNSIDNVFSVWKNRKPAQGQMILGAPFDSTDENETDFKRSMYGIVAVPVIAN